MRASLYASVPLATFQKKTSCKEDDRVSVGKTGMQKQRWENETVLTDCMSKDMNVEWMNEVKNMTYRYCKCITVPTSDPV